MGNISGKIWGQTELVFANSNIEFHRIDIKKGGTCSKHKHNYKFNCFYCMAGQLLIRTWKNDYYLVDETLLNSGDFMSVAPGEYHQFEAIEDCIAFELYYAHFDHDDIQRETVGELKQ